MVATDEESNEDEDHNTLVSMNNSREKIQQLKFIRQEGQFGHTISNNKDLGGSKSVKNQFKSLASGLQFGLKSLKNKKLTYHHKKKISADEMDSSQNAEFIT